MKNDKKNKPEIKVHAINLNDLKEGDEEIVRGIADVIADDNDLPDDVRAAIAGVINKVVKEAGEPFKDENEAHSAALNYFGECAPTMGQLVVRNEQGEKEYNCPKSGDGHFESAVVLDVWPHYQFDKHGKLVNGVIAVLTGKGDVHKHAVDLRLYKAANLVKN